MPQPKKLGPYRIDGVLGKGGMGRVYAATHEQTGDRVAIKALSPQLAMNEGFLERFRAEIESLRMLRHASIVRLFGYGQEGDTPFYAMELVDGPSLQDEVQQGRRFDWREVTDIATQVCRALKHAHDHGVIHRDIKPANILLTPAGRIKLADFGIARLFGGSQLTVAGGVLGTADYMAPEQIDGDAVTSQCDQYSLGGVMYALLAGRPPFVAKTLPEMLQLQRYAAPEPVRRYAAETPTQLEQTIDQMLRKSPAERFPNTLVLAKHLEAMRLALSRPPGPADPPPPAAGQETAPVATTTREISSADVLDHPSEAESLILLDNNETPSAPARVTGRDQRDQPTLAAADVEGGLDAAAEEPPRRRSLFTEVEEPPPSDASPAWALAAQAAVAVLLLGGMGWAGYSLFAPRDADALHADIEEALAAGDGAGLRNAAADVEAFLDRFPDDPRARDLTPVQDAISLDRLERRLTTKGLFARVRIDPQDASAPAEQLYLSAIQRGAAAPEAAIAELQALVVLLESGSLRDASSAAEFAALARRRIERLRERVATEQANYRPFVEAQLERARQLADDQPDEARRLCEAIVTLYADRPWAAEHVDQARALARQSR